MARIEIFTDGACSGNPGPGGWGVLLRYKDTEKEMNGGEAETTNNRMELTAVIEALQALKTQCVITLYTDSRYVMDGVKQWLPNWKRTTGKLQTKNLRLKTLTCGKNLMNWLINMKLFGCGSKAMPDILKTKGSTSWPEKPRRNIANKPQPNPQYF